MDWQTHWSYATFVLTHQYNTTLKFNTLRPRQDGCHFPNDIFQRIFLNENSWILIKISLKFVPKGPINNIPALVQIMAWCRPDDKPLFEPMVVSLLMRICVTRPQWVNVALHRNLQFSKWLALTRNWQNSVNIICRQITTYSTDRSLQQIW